MNQEEYEYFIRGEQMFGPSFVLEQRLRGRIIYNSILLEKVIEKIIAAHSSQNKEVPFSRKVKILKDLLKSSYADLFDQCSWIFDIIDELREIRNEFAHSETTVLIDDAVKYAQGAPIEGITLESWKNGKVEYKVIPTKKALEYMDRALALTILLNNIYSEIDYRISTKKVGSFNAERIVRVVNNVYHYAHLKKEN
jgi:hypothetical protein